MDLELLKFERQETDDMDEDDQDQLETERIDVKKDIALNDEIKPDESDIGTQIINQHDSQKINNSPNLEKNSSAGVKQATITDIVVNQEKLNQVRNSIHSKPPKPEYVQPTVMKEPDQLPQVETNPDFPSKSVKTPGEYGDEYYDEMVYDEYDGEDFYGEEGEDYGDEDMDENGL